MTTSSRWSTGRRTKAFGAAVLAVLGVLFLWTASVAPPATDVGRAVAPPEETVAAPSPSASEPTARRTTGTRGRSAVRDRTSGLVLPESHPVAVSIPKIGVRSKLVDLGLDPDGSMEVPEDPSLAGWFTRSAAAGALGPAVIAGHVTWNGRSAVFRHLGTLRRGDSVAVTRRDGRTAVFTVDRVARFSKSRFPTHEVYGTIDHAGLRVITCGGTYDAVRHRYLDNVVVFASLTSVRGPRG